MLPSGTQLRISTLGLLVLLQNKSCIINLSSKIIQVFLLSGVSGMLTAEDWRSVEEL